MTTAVETEPIQYEVDGPVARIWLNRPHKRNSVSQQLLQELDDARIRAENDPDVRVMVIRGREGTCARLPPPSKRKGNHLGHDREVAVDLRYPAIGKSGRR